MTVGTAGATGTVTTITTAIDRAPRRVNPESRGMAIFTRPEAAPASSLPCRCSTSHPRLSPYSWKTASVTTAPTLSTNPSQGPSTLASRKCKENALPTITLEAIEAARKLTSRKSARIISTWSRGRSTSGRVSTIDSIRRTLPLTNPIWVLIGWLSLMSGARKVKSSCQTMTEKARYRWWRRFRPTQILTDTAQHSEELHDSILTQWNAGNRRISNHTASQRHHLNKVQAIAWLAITRKIVSVSLSKLLNMIWLLVNQKTRWFRQFWIKRQPRRRWMTSPSTLA